MISSSFHSPLGSFHSSSALLPLASPRVPSPLSHPCPHPTLPSAPLVGRSLRSATRFLGSFLASSRSVPSGHSRLRRGCVRRRGKRRVKEPRHGSGNVKGMFTHASYSHIIPFAASLPPSSVPCSLRSPFHYPPEAPRARPGALRGEWNGSE